MFENIWILVNRFPESVKEILEKEVASINEQNVKFLGLLPNDEEISRMNLVGENLLQLPNHSEIYQTAKELFSTII